MVEKSSIQRTNPTPFLSKTYDLVNDPISDDMISWNENGKAFVVWKPNEFARDLLPRYFKHNNFSSFIRQLNTYGFRKIVSDRWEFANDYFRRGEKYLLKEIQRKKISIASTTTMVTSSPGNSSEELEGSSHSSPIATNCSNRTELIEENERLKEQNSKLKFELDQVRSLCCNVVTMVSNYITNEEIQIGGSEDKTEEEICPRLFGVSIGSKRMKRPAIEEQQDDEIQQE